MAGVAGVIAAINPTARVLHTQHSSVDPGDILDLRALAGLRCASIQAHCVAEELPGTSRTCTSFKA